MKKNKTGRIRSPSVAQAIASSILFVAIILGVMFYFDFQQDVLRLLEWLDSQGAWGPLLFVLMMMLVVVFVLPGFLLTTGAGFVFGVAAGTLYVVIGTTLGAMLAFLIARYTFGERASQFVFRHAKLKFVSAELISQGWKIILLSRLVPFFPFKISNYFFGLTQFSLRGFVGGTFIGIIPFSLHNAYLGSIAADIIMLDQRSSDRSALEWTLYGAGFLVAISALFYLNRLARRSLARYTEESTQGGM